MSATPTVTGTPTRSPTPRPTQPPRISYIGVARGDSTVVEPIDQIGEIKIFARGGTNFSIVVEADSGSSGIAPCTYAAECAFNDRPDDGLPDLQVLVSEPLGDGSNAVCDDEAPEFGGVPATSPPSFTLDPDTIAALNDLGCRFRDGTGRTQGRGLFDECTVFADGTPHYVSSDSELQFCAHITSPLEFPRGDTLVTARVRDLNGVYSAPAQIIIRVP